MVKLEDLKTESVLPAVSRDKEFVQYSRIHEKFKWLFWDEFGHEAGQNHLRTY
jgi:hypothetical protein